MPPAHPQYDALTDRFTRIHRFAHLQNIAHWDQQANMPERGNDARSAALAEMAALLHRLRTDPALGSSLDAAAGESLDGTQKANLREMRRQWEACTALPEALVEKRSLATSRCEHAWRTQRQANDWAGFLPNLKGVLAISREVAQRLADRSGLTPYDALMDQYEPGMTTAKVRQVFGDVRTWLPDLIRRVTEKQARETVLQPHGPFALDAQRALCERVMHLLQFDFSAGRLDVSAHPFSGGVPEDVRLTTRFREDDFVQSLMGTTSRTCRAHCSASRWPKHARWPCTKARVWPSRCNSAATRASPNCCHRCWSRPSATRRRSCRATCTGC